MIPHTTLLTLMGSLIKRFNNFLSIIYLDYIRRTCIMFCFFNNNVMNHYTIVNCPMALGLLGRSLIIQDYQRKSISMLHPVVLVVFVQIQNHFGLELKMLKFQIDILTLQYSIRNSLWSRLRKMHQILPPYHSLNDIFKVHLGGSWG